MSDTPSRFDLSEGDRAVYRTYQRVRDEVWRMTTVGESGGRATPSRYWEEELAQIDYLADASPLVIRKLRHHAFHITGVRPYDYRGAGEQRAHFERRLRALVARAGDASLLVGEHEALGGFGFTIDGRLHNIDTLKFFEVLVGMRLAGVLEPFESTSPRKTVVEIGAGWGGFAYQFKALFPRTTYIVIDLPELFLFSATYLMTVYPDARVRFWRPDDRLFDTATDVDFVFVPAQHADIVRAARPDLFVNLVSFQEMTTSQVEAYAELAAASNCPRLYSLNRERSAYNDELDSVSAILSRRYELHEVSVLGSGYLKATKKDSAVTVDEARRAGRLDPAGYRHLVGDLRPRGTPTLHGTPESRASLVGIGVTLRNRAEFLKEAVDSLLSQTYPHFQLVMVDDGSTDGTEAIARAYAARDPRVRYVRFAERRGMVAAWREAFEQASMGGARYFAWGSDHDRWHPEWLSRLVDTLDSYPEVVVAYPLTQRMSPDGAALAKPARQFETFGVTDLRARWRHFNRSDSVAAGDMVYGVMRVQAVRDAGVFRAVLCPDRLLLAELTLRGQIRQVPEVLWYRRQFESGSVGRQRETLFSPGARPPSEWTPPWYMHARSLWKTYAPGRAGLPLSRVEVRGFVLTYAAAYAWRHYGKSTVQRGILSVFGWPRWVYKRMKHVALLVLYGILVTSRRLGITPAIERLSGRSRTGARGRHHA